MNNILSYTEYLFESVKCPKEDLVTLDIEILNEDGETHTGKLKVHKDIKDDIISIFKELKEIGYPVECMKKGIQIHFFEISGNADVASWMNFMTARKK